MRRWNIILIIIVVLTCTVACGEEDRHPLETVELEETADAKATNGDIYVCVCGAVNREGVYQLPEGSRIYEAIELAGGFREDAAETEINQAEILQDEDRIYVPTISETVSTEKENDGKVNLNKATKDELMTLPGVGETRAESIIQYRNDNGGFKSIEEIMLISGIKEGLFEKIKDLIKI